MVEIGARNRDIFLATALDGFVIALLCRLENSLGALQGSCRQVTILRGDFVLGKELLGAVVVEFLLVQIGLRILHCLLRCLHFLLAGSGQRERKVGFAHPHAGLVNPHLLLGISVFQARQQRALLNLLPLLDRQIDDASLNLEAHQALVRFNVARKRELVRGRRLFDQARVEKHACRNRRSQQNQNRYKSLHSIKPRDQ